MGGNWSDWDEVGALGNNYRTQSSLTAINQAGTVSVGFSAVGGEQTPQGVAYTYGIRSRTAFGLEKDGGDPDLEELKPVGGAVLAWPWDVDEAGNTVGTSLVDAQTAPIYPHAVEWPAESGEARLLPNLRGEEIPVKEAVSQARAISRNGRYVVGHDTLWVEQEGGGGNSGYYNPRAVVWVKNRGATETTETDMNPWEVFDLNAHVPEGWEFTSAHGVSDEGVILVHGHRRMENGHWEPRAALLLPVEINEVASDQINDSNCNKLPTAKYAGEPNNPMLMAARSGVRAHLAIKVGSSEALQDKIYVGVRKVGTTTILGSVKVKAPNEKTKLEFDALPGHEIYEVVAGYDQNGNASLDNDEAQIIFKKTPAGSATSGLQYLDKIIIVTESQFESSKFSLYIYSLAPAGYASDLIGAFGKGANTIPNASTSSGISISANEPGLSHPVGGRWNSDCKDDTYRFTFAEGSPASNDFEGSNAFEQIVEKVAKDNLAALVAAYDGSVEWLVSQPYTFNESKDLIETEAVFIGFNKLGSAFGKVDIGGTIRFSYKKTEPNSITVGSVEVIGSFDDLYDFAYGGGDQARQASMVQAGHATLAKAPESDAGKVFFIRLEFNSGWKNWNRNYTNQ